MSSGEADAIHVQSVLDLFIRCPVDGCNWKVIGGGRCRDHGGERKAQYATSADGEFLDARFTPAQGGDDAA